MEKIKDYQVLTSNGFKNFDAVKETIRTDGLRITLQNGKYIDCTPEHKFYIDGFIYAKDLKIGDVLLYNGTKIKIKSISKTTETRFYDLINVSDGHHYTANGIEVSNCAFLPPNRYAKFTDSFFPAQAALAWKKNIIISTANGLNHFYTLVKGAQTPKKQSFEDCDVKMPDGTIKRLSELVKA